MVYIGVLSSAFMLDTARSMRHFPVSACLLLLAPPALVHASAFAYTPASVVAGSCPAPRFRATRMCVDDLAPIRIAFDIAADGRLRKARLVQGSGIRILDKDTVSALSTCRWLPARLGGKPVPGIVHIAYTWTFE